MLVNAPLICHVEMTRLNTGFWLGIYTFLPERAKKTTDKYRILQYALFQHLISLVLYLILNSGY